MGIMLVCMLVTSYMLNKIEYLVFYYTSYILSVSGYYVGSVDMNIFRIFNGVVLYWNVSCLRVGMWFCLFLDFKYLVKCLVYDWYLI